MDLKNKVIIFSDGACSGNPGPGGWAAVILTPQKQSYLVEEIAGAESNTTNNKMEISAVGSALRKFENQNVNVLVFTDSTYVIQGITSWVKTWKKNGWTKSSGDEVANIEYWKRFDELVNSIVNAGGKVDFHYVPGHSGVAGNERCDELSVQASQRLDLKLFKGDFSEYKSFLKTDVLKNIDQLADKPKQKSKKPIYVSVVDGKPRFHDTWSDCEMHVKGRPHVKFKKCASREEAEALLASWGYSKVTE